MLNVCVECVCVLIVCVECVCVCVFESVMRVCVASVC